MTKLWIFTEFILLTKFENEWKLNFQFLEFSGQGKNVLSPFTKSLTI